LTRRLMEIDGDDFANEEYGLLVSNDDAINAMHQKLDGMVQMGLQNQMLSFSTAMKIYNSPSMREIQRMIEKSESDMKENEAKKAEEAGKAQKAQLAQAQAQYEANVEIEQKRFEREDDTKRYIAELN